MVDDFPSPEQDSYSRFQLKLPFESDEGHKKTHPKAERKKEKNMQKRKVNYEKIAEEVRMRRCCSRRCIPLILTVSDIYKTREWFVEKSREAARTVPFKRLFICKSYQ